MLILLNPFFLNVDKDQLLIFLGELLYDFASYGYSPFSLSFGLSNLSLTSSNSFMQIVAPCTTT